MADEHFYGATLKGENSVVTWSPQEKEADEPERANKLIIKQFLLGVEAKSDEYNVIEVETIAKDESIKIPVAVLKVGENRLAQSFLEFPDAPVTFKLIQGSGPVHIHGHHLVGDYDVMEDMEEEDFADEEDDSEHEIKAEMKDEDDEPKLKKQKLSKGGAKVEKNNKKK